MMQQREDGDSWPAFSADEIETFYSMNSSYQGYSFNRLVSYPNASTSYMTVRNDGMYQVTP